MIHRQTVLAPLAMLLLLSPAPNKLVAAESDFLKQRIDVPIQQPFPIVIETTGHRSGVPFCLESSEQPLTANVDLGLRGVITLSDLLRQFEKGGYNYKLYTRAVLVSHPSAKPIKDNPLDTHVDEFHFEGAHSHFIKKIGAIFPELPPNIATFAGSVDEDVLYKVDFNQRVSIRDILMRISSDYSIAWHAEISTARPVYDLKSPDGSSVAAKGSRITLSFWRVTKPQAMRLLSNQIDHAEDAVSPGKSSRTDFLPDRVNRHLMWLWAYGRYPASAKGLDHPAMNENVAKWFPPTWLGFLKPELIPGDTFVRENVKLVPAEEMQQLVAVDTAHFSPNEGAELGMDVLFLRFQAGDREYLLAETVKHLMVFVRIKENASNKVARVSDVVLPSLSMRGVTFIQFSLGGCLLIDKEISTDRRPARSPQPNKWFENLKKAAE